MKKYLTADTIKSVATLVLICVIGFGMLNMPGCDITTMKAEAQQKTELVNDLNERIDEVADVANAELEILEEELAAAEDDVIAQQIADKIREIRENAQGEIDLFKAERDEAVAAINDLNERIQSAESTEEAFIAVLESAATYVPIPGAAVAVGLLGLWLRQKRRFETVVKTIDDVQERDEKGNIVLDAKQMKLAMPRDVRTAINKLVDA